MYGREEAQFNENRGCDKESGAECKTQPLTDPLQLKAFFTRNIVQGNGYFLKIRKANSMSFKELI